MGRPSPFALFLPSQYIITYSQALSSTAHLIILHEAMWGSAFISWNRLIKGSRSVQITNFLPYRKSCTPKWQLTPFRCLGIALDVWNLKPLCFSYHPSIPTLPPPLCCFEPFLSILCPENHSSFFIKQHFEPSSRNYFCLSWLKI